MSLPSPDAAWSEGYAEFLKKYDYVDCEQSVELYNEFIDQ